MLDLVSPWTAAVEANDSAGLATFRERHGFLLDLLRLEHTPHTRHLPLLTDLNQLRKLHTTVVKPAFRQSLETTMQDAASLGANVTTKLVLLPVEPMTTTVTPIPATAPLAILALSRDDMLEATFTIPLIRALAKLTRWCAPDSKSGIRASNTLWNRWELARTIPLREWLYAEGMGWHLAQAIYPATPVHELFSVGTGGWQRLREQESSARAQLVADLDERGVGLVMRWLMSSATVSARTTNGVTLPPMMGHYLAWRMTAKRVARIGISAAIRDVA